MQFSEDDKKRVAQAVAKAESATSGEIVPLVVDSSDPYAYADLIGGVIGEIVFLLANFWIFPDSGPVLISAMLAAGFVAGFMITRRAPAVKRFLLGDKIPKEEVLQRAMQAFVEHDLASTRDRTGILIMISLLERRVQVLADSGIHKKVPAGTWDEVVRLILDGIRKGSVTDGLVAGIARCGEILAKDFPRKPDDADEIRNDLIEE